MEEDAKVDILEKSIDDAVVVVAFPSENQGNPGVDLEAMIAVKTEEDEDNTFLTKQQVPPQ